MLPDFDLKTLLFWDYNIQSAVVRFDKARAPVRTDPTSTYIDSHDLNNPTFTLECGNGANDEGRTLQTELQ